MKRKFLISSILIIIVILSTNVLIAFAATKSELQQQSSDLQTQIDKTEEEIGEVQSNISATMKQVQSLIAEISDYESEIDDLDNQIDDLETQIDDAQEKLEEAEKNYNEQQKMLENRLVAMYEAGETTYLDVLLSSSSVADFISNYYIISEITSYDSDLLDQMEKNKNEIAIAKEALETSKNQVEIVKNNKEKTASALKNSQEQKEEYASQLSEDEKSLKEELEQFERDKAAIQSELASIAAREAASGGTTVISGSPSNYGYIFPVAGLSKSNINNRNYPSYPGHTGVDVNIGVVGKKVVAVKAGTVEISTACLNANGTYRSYGEYVVINHHDGTMTLYAHMLAGTRQVHKGDEVVQGQVLGTVGSTGKSTGTHLHFEVRVNGSCVNPLPYLP